MNVQLLLIDPQNDFAHPSGHLFVPGAYEDAVRLAAMIDRYRTKIDQIHLTLDSHHLMDIAHPLFWVNEQGQPPPPFTLICEHDLVQGLWKTRHPSAQQRALCYVQSLKANGRYELCIWPPHCLIGSPGHNIVQPIAQAVWAWEQNNAFAWVNYVMKGSNVWTEHYSALQADVPDPQDPSTQLNVQLINALKKADKVFISGQALSHCVANTVRDIAHQFGDESLEKLVLLEDTTSSVPGFEQLGYQFITDMCARGMQLAKSTDILIE